MRKYITIPFEEYTTIKNHKKDLILTNSMDVDSAVGDGHTAEEYDRVHHKSASQGESPTAESSHPLTELHHPSPLPPHHEQHVLSQKKNMKKRNYLKERQTPVTSSSESSVHSEPHESASQHHAISDISGSPTSEPDLLLDGKDRQVNVGRKDHRQENHTEVPAGNARRRWKRGVDHQKSLTPVSEGQASGQGNHNCLTSRQIDRPVDERGNREVEVAARNYPESTITELSLSVDSEEETSDEEQAATLEKEPLKRVSSPVLSPQSNLGEWGSMWNVSNLTGAHQKKKIPVLPSVGEKTSPDLNQDQPYPDTHGSQVQSQELSVPVHHRGLGPAVSLGKDSVQGTRDGRLEKESDVAVQRQNQLVNRGVQKSRGLKEDQEPLSSNPALSARLPPPGVPPEKKRIISKIETGKSSQGSKIISEDISVSKKADSGFKPSDSSTVLRHNPRPKRTNAGKNPGGWRGLYKT